jgi:predicted membrane metal-binding protein
MSRYQPALFGGLLIGVLSSIPFVSGLNMCCCLWVVCGGLLTTYLLQQRTPVPILTSDAMLQGVLAGLIGAVITCTVTALTFTVMGPMLQEPMRQAMDRPDLPPEARAFIEKFMTPGGLILFTAILYIPTYAIFAMLGALLGTAFFKKKGTVPPVAPPPMPPQL